MAIVLLCLAATISSVAGNDAPEGKKVSQKATDAAAPTAEVVVKDMGEDDLGEESANGPDASIENEEERAVGEEAKDSEIEGDTPTPQVESARTAFEKITENIEFDPSHILIFEVGSNVEDCLMETIKSKKSVSGSFFVDSGDDADKVIVNVKSDDSEVFYDSNGPQKEGDFHFEVTSSNIVRFCFRNYDSSSTKRIVFAVDVASAESSMSVSEILKSEHLDTSRDSIRRMDRMSNMLEQNVKFMGMRLDNQAIVQDSLNENVVMWSVIESSVVLGVTFMQVRYIRNLINSRTKVLV